MMLVEQFFVKGLAHSSYLVAGAKTCAVIDPRRDVGIYIDAAREMGVRITHILETHLHADFVSGHRDLARLTGAEVYAPGSGNCLFEHVAVSEGDVFRIEDMEVAVLETPGHTPEHISYVFSDLSRGQDPVALFCGDTLFVGDVGRPDLFPGKAEELAEALFESLHEKILKLPDHCEVYPAHGAGSLCGRAMGAKRSTTIGYERRHNEVLQITDRAEFIRSLTTAMPAAPDHFARCSEINRRGPALMSELGVAARMEPDEFAGGVADSKGLVLDIRSYEAFGGQHVPGAFHIDMGGNFPTFAGWVLPSERPIFLVGDTAEKIAQAIVHLRRVGLDDVRGYLDGGMFSWSRSGKHAGHVAQLSAKELHDMTRSGDPVAILDVRAPSEFGAGHIEGALNIPAPDLRHEQAELPKDLTIVTVCSTGHRSSLAASLLARRGYERVFNLAGGMSGYGARGFGPECPVCYIPHASRFLPGTVR